MYKLMKMGATPGTAKIHPLNFEFLVKTLAAQSPFVFETSSDLRLLKPHCGYHITAHPDVLADAIALSPAELPRNGYGITSFKEGDFINTLVNPE